MWRIQVAPKNVQNVNLQFLEQFDYETSNFTQLFTSQLAYHLAYAMHSIAIILQDSFKQINV